VIDTSVILGDGVLHVFASNRSLDAEHELKIDLAGATIQSLRDAEIVTGTDPKASNSFENPNVVTKETFNAATVQDGVATVTLPALSFTAMTFNLA
jgi:alpha-N-arabinofuranosidase